MSEKKQLGEKGFRHELKYYITEGDYALLKRKLSLTMEQDAFAKKSGGEYFIRSLYFDDRDDSAFREKLDGTDERDKFRIRIYNMRDDVIKLECKHKSNGYIKKQSVNLSRKEYEQLMMGRRGFLLNRPEPFAKRMYLEFTQRALKPAVIVDYTREPFVFPMEDVPRNGYIRRQSAHIPGDRRGRHGAGGQVQPLFVHICKVAFAAGSLPKERHKQICAVQKV